MPTAKPARRALRLTEDDVLDDAGNGLTALQRAFCDAYLGTARRNPALAYEMALPAGTTEQRPRDRGRAMLHQPAVRTYLQRRGRELAAAAEVTQEQIILDLVELREMSMGRKATPLARFHEGELVHGLARNVDFAGATRVLDLLGRYLGMWTSDVRVEGAGNTVVMLNLGGRVIEGEAVRT